MKFSLLVPTLLVINEIEVVSMFQESVKNFIILPQLVILSKHFQIVSRADLQIQNYFFDFYCSEKSGTHVICR